MLSFRIKILPVMITLKISFLLAIDLKESIQISERKLPSKKNKRKKQKFLKKKKTKKHKTVSKKDDLPDENFSVIEVQNPICYIRIDYELFDKKFVYGMDIVCWGPVAKIYTKNGTKCFKTVIRGDIVWIPVFIEHNLNSLSTEEIRQLLNQMIKVHVRTGEDNVGKKTRGDKITKFYLHKDDSENEFFPELFNHKVNLAVETAERILKRLLHFPVNKEIVTWIYNMNNVHAYKIKDIITKKSDGEEICCHDLYEEEQPKIKDKKKNRKNRKKQTKKSIKGSNKKKSKHLNMVLKIPSDVLLSDPVLITYQKKDIKDHLKECFVLLSTENMLTYEQIMELCPLVVKIHKIINLKKEILQDNGIQNVYISCNIPGLTEFQTSKKPVGSSVVFNESRFIITNDFPHIKLVEILQTRRVITKVMGVGKEITSNAETKTKKKKKKKEKKKTKKKKSKSKSNLSSTEKNFESVALMAATFDLSPLSKTFFLFKEKGQCYNMRSLPSEHHFYKYDFFLDNLTTNEINLNNIDKRTGDVLLTDDVLFFEGTMVDLEAHFLSPANPLFYIHDVGDTYRRFLIFFLKQDFAKIFLHSILSHNQQFKTTETVLFPTFRSLKKNISSTVLNEHNQVLSGFCIDDGNCFIIYGEGPSNGYILTLLHQLRVLNYSTARVFYNSDYIFEERLYKGFHISCGIFTTTLKLPLSVIFAQKKLYVEGNAPMHCFKAVQKLNLMFLSSKFKTLLSNEVLPTEVELLSLSIEYGLQIKYHGFDSYGSDWTMVV